MIFSLIDYKLLTNNKTYNHFMSEAKNKTKSKNNTLESETESHTSDLLVYFNINGHKFCLSYDKQYILNKDNWQNAYYDLLNSNLMPEVLSCLNYEDYVDFIIQSIKENNITDFSLSNYQNTNDTVQTQHDIKKHGVDNMSLSQESQEPQGTIEINANSNIDEVDTNNLEKTTQHNRYTQQKVNLQTNEQNDFLIEIYTREIKNLSLCLTSDFNQNISTINKIDFLINRIKICDVLNKLNNVNEGNNSFI